MAKYLDAMARAQKARETRRLSPDETQPSKEHPVHSVDETQPSRYLEEMDSAGPEVVTSGSELAEELERVERTGSYEDQADERVIPAAKPAPMKPSPMQPVSNPGGQGYHPEIDDSIISVHDLMSPITEQVRHIRTNLETVLQGFESRPIVVSSPVSGDGKTLFTANLACVLADDPDHQVILLDGDMRKPDQHNLFNLKSNPGLAEYLAGRAELDEIIQPTSLPNLSVVAAGYPPGKPTSLLKSERCAKMIHQLQRKYHWVLFDTPPLLPVTDASVIARETVGLIMVVRMGQTHRNTVARAQELLAETRIPVLGCVLNDYVSESPENSYYTKYYARKDDKRGFKS